MKWFCCDIIFHLQGEFVWANDASVILFGLALHISQTPAEQCNPATSAVSAYTALPPALAPTLPFPMSLLPHNLLLYVSLLLEESGFSINVMVTLICICSRLSDFLYLVKFSYLHQKQRLPADLARTLRARPSLLLGTPLATQNLQTCLPLSPSVRFQSTKRTVRTWPVPDLSYTVPPYKRCSTSWIPVRQAVHN